MGGCIDPLMDLSSVTSNDIVPNFESAGSISSLIDCLF